MKMYIRTLCTHAHGNVSGGVRPAPLEAHLKHQKYAPAPRLPGPISSGSGWCVRHRSGNDLNSF